MHWSPQTFQQSKAERVEGGGGAGRRYGERDGRGAVGV